MFLLAPGALPARAEDALSRRRLLQYLGPLVSSVTLLLLLMVSFSLGLSDLLKEFLSREVDILGVLSEA